MQINQLYLLLLVAAVLVTADDPPRRRRRLRNRRREGPGAPFRPGGMFPLGGHPIMLPMGGGFGGYPNIVGHSPVRGFSPIGGYGPMGRHNPIHTGPLQPPIGLPAPTAHSFSPQSYAPPLARHAGPSIPQPIHVGSPFSSPSHYQPSSSPFQSPSSPFQSSHSSPFQSSHSSPFQSSHSSPFQSSHSSPYQGYQPQPQALHQRSTLSIEELQRHNPMNHMSLSRGHQPMHLHNADPIYINSPPLIHKVEERPKTYENVHMIHKVEERPKTYDNVHNVKSSSLSETACVNCNVGKHSTHFTVKDDGSVIKQGFTKHFSSHSSANTVKHGETKVKHGETDFKDSHGGRFETTYGGGAHDDNTKEFRDFGGGAHTAEGVFRDDFSASPHDPHELRHQNGGFDNDYKPTSSSHHFQSQGRHFGGRTPYVESVEISSYSKI